MSGTRRTPINRPTRRRFSPEALETFRTLRDARGCTCAPTDWRGKYWLHERCAGCRRWSDLHAELFKLWPDARPWFWPVVERPDARSPYPPDHGGTAQWRESHRESSARWTQIERALIEYDRRSAARA